MSWLFGGLDSSLRSSTLGNLQPSRRASAIKDSELRWTERALPDPSISRYLHLELCGEEDRLHEMWSLPAVLLLQSSTQNSSSSNTSNMSQYSFSSPLPSSPLRASVRGGGGMLDFDDEEEDEDELEYDEEEDDMELDDDERIPSPPLILETAARRRFA